MLQPWGVPTTGWTTADRIGLGVGRRTAPMIRQTREFDQQKLRAPLVHTQPVVRDSLARPSFIGVAFEGGLDGVAEVPTMKTVRNKTTQPIRVPLGRGKILHLGPKMDAQIADGAVELAGVKKLVKAGTIEILGEGEHERQHDGGGAGASVPEQKHGRAKSTLIRPGGER